MSSIYRDYIHKMVISYVISDAGLTVECRLQKSKRSKDNNVVCRRHDSDRLLLFCSLVPFTHSKPNVCGYVLGPNRVCVYFANVNALQIGIAFLCVSMSKLCVGVRWTWQKDFDVFIKFGKKMEFWKNDCSSSSRFSIFSINAFDLSRMLVGIRSTFIFSNQEKYLQIVSLWGNLNSTKIIGSIYTWRIETVPNISDPEMYKWKTCLV